MSGDTIVLWLPKPPDNANARQHWAAANRLKRAFQGELTSRLVTSRPLPQC